MADMLVKLFALQPDPTLAQRMQAQGVRVCRALPPDRDRVIAFVQQHFPEFAAEVACAFAHLPVRCYIATEGKALVGFACYEVTAPDFFGPTAVLATHRRRGIGRALLLASLLSLKELGYAYAIIGWPAQDAVAFYEHAVGAQRIPDDTPGLYRDMIDQGGNGTV